MCDNLFDLTQPYNHTLSSLLDKHAPMKSKTITEPTHAEWYISKLGDQKCAIQKLERKSNHFKLAINADIYQTASDAYNKCLYDTKVNQYNGLISEAANNQRTLFSLIDKLLSHTSASPLSSHESPADLADTFANFFDDKMDKIYKCLSVTELNDVCTSPTSVSFTEPSSPVSLSSFEPVNQETVLNLFPCIPH